jgi:hypothetical protein
MHHPDVGLPLIADPLPSLGHHPRLKNSVNLAILPLKCPNDPEAGFHKPGQWPHPEKQEAHAPFLPGVLKTAGDGPEGSIWPGLHQGIPPWGLRRRANFDIRGDGLWSHAWKREEVQKFVKFGGRLQVDGGGFEGHRVLGIEWGVWA